MTSAQEDWSVRASYWRGDRALGGHLRVADGVLGFEPHGLERALGGNTRFSTPLRDVVRLARALRSFKVPRRRLIVTTRSGEEAFFLVSTLDDVIQKLEAAVEAQGGSVEIDLEPTGRIDVPENHPDNSLPMSWIHSGWLHVAGFVAALLLFVSALFGSRNGMAMAAFGAIAIYSAWRARIGFRRRQSIRAQLAEPPPESS